MTARAVILGGLVVVAIVGGRSAWRFLAQDKCLDAGGIWHDGACDPG